MPWLRAHRPWLWLSVGLGLWLSVILAQPGAIAQDATLPPLAVHPLPAQLADWHPTLAEDYFDEIRAVDGVGYLVWADRPVQVYIEPPTGLNDRSQVWQQLVREAVEDWAVYFPLQITSDLEQSQIRIWRDTPAIERDAQNAPRARAAETRYRIYVKDLGDDRAQLQLQMTLIIRPGQSDRHIVAATRHELGHALGLWGHSPDETDVLFYSQVRHPPPISQRDINTLKRLYQQPTRLGWPVVRSPSPSSGATESRVNSG
jgi:predicted Zn-dependent protease